MKMTATYETTYDLAIYSAQMINIDECRTAEAAARSVSALSPEYKNAWLVANTAMAASNRKYHATVDAAFDAVNSARYDAAPDARY
jgi:hypothetical protein